MTALAQKLHLVSKIAAAKSGTAVTLTLDDPGTYDASAGAWSGASTVTMTGTVERIRGEPARYQELGLVESEAPTLQFTPDTFGDVPRLLMKLTLGADDFEVRDVEPWAPDGNSISSSIVVAR